MNAPFAPPSVKLRPSGAERWGNCAGSHQLEAQYPEEDGPEAREGTAAHYFATEALQGRVHPIGALAPNGHPIDADMVEHGQTLIDDVTAELRASNGNRIHYFIEAKVFAHQTVHPDNEGSPDVFLVDYDRQTLVLWDYKYGHGYVDAFENLQLINYFAAILESLGLAAPAEFAHGWRVSLRVIQPRNYHGDGPVRIWDTTPAALAPYVQKLREAAYAAKQPGARVTTGPHCRHCTALRGCEVGRRFAASLIEMSGAAVSNELPPAALGVELRRVELAIKRLTAYRDALHPQALAHIAAGRDVPYWSKGYVDSRERWKVDLTQIAALGDVFGVPLIEQKAVTPAQARKLGVDAAVISEYAEKPRGAAKLIPADGVAARKAFS